MNQLLDEECEIVPADKIFVTGFSQGGALAVSVGYQYKKKLGGVVSSSAWVLGGFIGHNLVKKENKEVPLFVFHGESDDVIPWKMAKESYEDLAKTEGLKAPVYSTARGVGHSITEKQFESFVEIFRKTVF